MSDKLHDPVETCDTWLLRKSTGPAKHRTIRNLNDSSGIFVCRRNQMASSWTPSGVHRQPSSPQRASGLNCSANCASESFGSPPCAQTATEHLRVLVGLSGVHRALRGPPEHPRVFAGNLRHLSPSGLTREPFEVRRTTCGSAEGFGLPRRASVLHRVGWRHRVSSDAHRSFGSTGSLSRSRGHLSKVSALRW